MSPLRTKTAGEITGFIRGWLDAISHNDKLYDRNTVSHVLQDILEYACPNEFGKTDDNQETAENVNHIPTYEESPTYCSNAASTYLRTIGDLRTIANAIKWADEHPKVELPKWKRMPPSDQSYVDDFVCVRHIITPESTSLEVVQKGNYYILMSDLEKFPKEE